MQMAMNNPGRFERQGALLDRTIDDLLLQLRGLVLVGKVLEQRGASPAEVDEHAREADRVRAELAGLIGDGAQSLPAPGA
jgi:hypothetical protein